MTQQQTKPNPAPAKPVGKPGETVAIQKREVQFLESDAFKQAIKAVLPQHITPERMARVCMTAVMGKPELIEACNNPVGKASLLNALMRCSQAGLEPDGRLAHLIPFWSKDHKTFLIQLIFDYKGLITLASRNGIKVKATIVCEDDDFEYIEDDGNGKTIVRHSFNPFAARGAVIGVYSRAVEEGKDPDYEFMTIEEVNKVKARSKAGDSGPWKTDTNEMIRKTPIRRHSKRWDLLPEVRSAIQGGDDDTPIDIPTQVQTTRPMFGSPEPQGQLGEGEGPLPQGQEPQTQPEPKPEAEPEPKKQSAKMKPDPTSVQLLRSAAKTHNIGEGTILDYLASTGATDGSIQSLDELAISAPDVLNQLVADWAKDHLKIREWKEAQRV